jgi:hypothetical protein
LENPKNVLARFPQQHRVIETKQRRVNDLFSVINWVRWNLKNQQNQLLNPWVQLLAYHTSTDNYVRNSSVVAGSKFK